MKLWCKQMFAHWYYTNPKPVFVCLSSTQFSIILLLAGIIEYQKCSVDHQQIQLPLLHIPCHGILAYHTYSLNLVFRERRDVSEHFLLSRKARFDSQPQSGDLTTICNSSFNVLFWPLQTTGTHVVSRHICKQTPIQIIFHLSSYL